MEFMKSKIYTIGKQNVTLFYQQYQVSNSGSGTSIVKNSSFVM